MSNKDRMILVSTCVIMKGTRNNTSIPATRSSCEPRGVTFSALNSCIFETTSNFSSGPFTIYFLIILLTFSAKKKIDFLDRLKVSPPLI